MNLKTAARQLGVHYQTAYRYVRSGELVAVKLGSGYEISQAAVDMLQGRLNARLAPYLHREHDPPPDSSAVEDRIDAMVGALTLTAQPVFDKVTEWLAMNVGDLAVLRLISSDGMFAPAVASHDADPVGQAVLTAFLSSVMPRSDVGPTGAVLAAQATVVEHHVPATTAVAGITPQFQQYAPYLVSQSFVAVPVRSAGGRVLGTLKVCRRPGGRPYTAETVSLVERMAERVGAAIAAVERFSAAWVARDTLHESLTRLFVLGPSLSLHELSDVALDLLDEVIPEAVFDLDAKLVVANEPFLQRHGLTLGLGDLPQLGAGLNIVCPHLDMAHLWAQLMSGSSDYLSTPTADCAPSAHLAGIHWVVIRRPDASPVAVVAACETGREQSEWAPRSSTCWNACRRIVLTNGS